MLVEFCILFSKSNSDLVVGHELVASTFEVLLKRMQALLIDGHDLGRLHNQKMGSYRGGLRYNLREVFSGRLLFDVYELARTSLKLESYTLPDMVRHFFPDSLLSQDNLVQKLENNLFLLKIGDRLKIFFLTL